MPQVGLSIYVPVELYQEMKRRGNMSEIVREAVVEYLERREG